MPAWGKQPDAVDKPKFLVGESLRRCRLTQRGWEIPLAGAGPDQWELVAALSNPGTAETDAVDDEPIFIGNFICRNLTKGTVVSIENLNGPSGTLPLEVETGDEISYELTAFDLDGDPFEIEFETDLDGHNSTFTEENGKITATFTVPDVTPRAVDYSIWLTSGEHKYEFRLYLIINGYKIPE